jgi:hypothetical protein
MVDGDFFPMFAICGNLGRIVQAAVSTFFIKNNIWGQAHVFIIRTGLYSDRVAVYSVYGSCAIFGLPVLRIRGPDIPHLLRAHARSVRDLAGSVARVNVSAVCLEDWSAQFRGHGS